MIWTLVICGGISGWGCGTVSTAPYPNEESCYKALEHVRFDVNTPGETRRSAYAYCRPNMTEIPK